MHQMLFGGERPPNVLHTNCCLAVVIQADGGLLLGLLRGDPGARLSPLWESLPPSSDDPSDELQNAVLTISVAVLSVFHVSVGVRARA